MAQLQSRHKELTNGVGCCSVPMWCNGLPAGFCDAPAFGTYVDGPRFRDAYTGEVRRMDGVYSGYVPALACPAHGGPKQKAEWLNAHFGDPCAFCHTPHDDVQPGPCPARVSEDQ